MPIDRTPVIRPCLTIEGLIEFILSCGIPTTTIVCCQHAIFSEGLHTAAKQEEQENDEEPLHQGSDADFLRTTMHQLLTSRIVGLAFTPTLPQLRAYLATVEFCMEQIPHSRLQSSYQRAPNLVIYGLLELHLASSEFSAQGLSRTFAVATEAARRCSAKLIIVEPLRINNGEVLSSSNEFECKDLWKTQIPLLNGNSRSSDDDRIWAGKTIEIAQVANRWCSVDCNECIERESPPFQIT